jgi:uncharacterized protein (TIGR00725 family)
MMIRSGAAALPIVGVMGSGVEPHGERAEPLGRWLAGIPVHLLTGGGAGVMSSVSRAFYQVSPRAGCVIGILPASASPADRRSPAGYPNPWVEIGIATHLPLSGRQGADPLSRNHINVLTADVVVALPGGHGTASEVALALRYGRPLIVFADGAQQIPGLVDTVRIEPDFRRVQEFVRATIGSGSTPSA